MKGLFDLKTEKYTSAKNSFKDFSSASVYELSELMFKIYIKRSLFYKLEVLLTIVSKTLL